MRDIHVTRTGERIKITDMDDWLDNGMNPVGCPYCKQPAAAGPEASGQKPMTLVDVCLKDAEELREIAAHFDALWDEVKGDFLREVANRHEILAGAYQTSTVRYERELKEWIERGRTAEDKAAALKWLEEMRGADECRAGEGERND